MKNTEYWNYRIIKSKQNESFVYQIHEVYYDKDDNIVSWTQEPVNPSGEYLSELREDVFYFMSAFRYLYLIEVEKDGKTKLEAEKDDKEKISKMHNFEVLDRASVIMNTFSDSIIDHPFIKQNKKYRKKAESIFSKLYKFYNMLSVKLFIKK